MQCSKDQLGWIAVYVAPHCERTVSRSLAEKGYSEFCPVFLQRKKWSDRTKILERPLFPRYVFCRMESMGCGLIVTTPGVVKILGHNGVPSFIPDDQISALKRIHHLRFPVAPLPLLDVGKQIVVKSGPLEGVRGHILRISNNTTLVISIEILQRAVAVTLPLDSVLDDHI